MERNTVSEVVRTRAPFNVPIVKSKDIVGRPKAQVCVLDGRYEIPGSQRKGRVISVCYGDEGQTANVWWEEEDEPMVVDLETLTLAVRRLPRS